MVIQTRRNLLQAGAGAFALAACGRATTKKPWEFQPAVLDLPGFKLWNKPPSAETNAPMDTAILTADGARTLGEIVGDGPALISFWASWCHPCLAEKPSLDALAGRLKTAKSRISVLSLNVFEKTPSLDHAAAASARLRLSHLAPLADATTGTSPFAAYLGMEEGEIFPSLPKSVLILPDGHELGRIQGALTHHPPADWKPDDKTNVDEAISSWASESIWSDESMIQFLMALGA